MIIANFMDSSLLDLQKKGVITNAPEIYNPGRRYERVLHFTPHIQDIGLQSDFEPWHITLIHYPALGINPVSFLVSLVKVWHIFRREKVQLVRGRLPYMGSLIGLIAARLQGIPFVVSLGGDNRIGQCRTGQYHYNSKFLSYGMEWLVLRFANSVIAPNQFTARYVADIIGARNSELKTIVIPWLSKPIIPKEDVDLNHMGFSKDQLIVLIIGFLNKYKYTDVIYDAIDTITLPEEHHNKVVFCFCGDGPLKEDGTRRFADRSDIRFLGWQDHAIISALILKSACVLIPMSGFVLLEAASAGKPVITSDVEWHQELVIDGVTGLVVDPENPQMWREAIIRLFCGTSGASEMGNRLKQRYLNHYAPERSVKLEHELYEKLISGKK